MELKNIRMDSWVNSLLGIGNDRDKLSANTIVSRSMIDDELDRVFHGDETARVIVTKKLSKALEKGFSVQISADKNTDVDDIARTKEDQNALNEKLKKLELREKVEEAETWANVFGGAAMLIGASDGSMDLAQPLNENNIQEVTHLNVLDRRYCTPWAFYGDISQPNYGKPETYKIFETPIARRAYLSKKTGRPGEYNGVEVHESRLYWFGGLLTSASKKAELGGYDISLLYSLTKVLSDWGINWGILKNMLTDASQAVVAIKNFYRALAGENEDVMKKRMALLDMNRSASRLIAIDAESESFTRQPYSWSGIEEPFNLLMMQLSMVTEIPVTILMGRSPAGENSTGQSDFQGWYDHLGAYQTKKFEPAIERVVELICKSKQGPTNGQIPKSWKVYFPPLKTMTQKEMAETHKLQAEQDAAYINASVLSPEEVALSRFGPDGWSDETVIDFDARSKENTELMRQQEIEEERARQEQLALMTNQKEENGRTE